MKNVDLELAVEGCRILGFRTEISDLFVGLRDEPGIFVEG